MDCKQKGQEVAESAKGAKEMITYFSVSKLTKRENKLGVVSVISVPAHSHQTSKGPCERLEELLYAQGDHRYRHVNPNFQFLVQILWTVFFCL